jgi:hypothetical protein
LVVLQGTLYGLGGGQLFFTRARRIQSSYVHLALLHAAAIYYMSEWFVERRGLANGVIGAGQLYHTIKAATTNDFRQAQQRVDLFYRWLSRL